MRLIPIFVMLVVLVLVRLFFYYDARHIYEENDIFQKTYRFLQEPKKNAYSQYFFVDDIFVSLPLFPKYSYGDEIKIFGTIKKLTTKNGELLSLNNPKIEKVNNPNFIVLVSKFVREKVVEAVTTTLPRKEGGLMLGIILGVRDKIDSEFGEELSLAGVMHVVAASGQNVSILASILLLSFGKVVKRKFAILFTAIGILFYSLLAGFDPPIVRASIMALIGFGAMLFGRQNLGILALFLTGWVMIMTDPRLLEGISFQLSFLSTFGILVIKPLMDSLKSFKMFGFLKEDLTTTLAAQLMTLPLILSTFGSYSLLSLPINVLVLWTVPIIMILGGVGAILAVISPVISFPLLMLTYPFLLYFTLIIQSTGLVNYSFNIDSVPLPLIFGYYLILFAIVIRLIGRRRVKI